MPWRSPPERLATVESTLMPTPRKPIRSLEDLSAISFSLDVDEAEAVRDLATDEEVAPERLLVGERTILIDRLDREVVRHAHRIVGEVELPVANEDASRGRRQHAGHDLDQRRLARAVVADQADDLVPANRQIDVARAPGPGQRISARLRGERYPGSSSRRLGRRPPGSRFLLPVAKRLQRRLKSSNMANDGAAIALPAPFPDCDEGLGSSNAPNDYSQRPTGSGRPA